MKGLFILLAGIAAAALLFPLANAQGTAPAMSLMVNGAYVSSSNPLPVTGGATSAPQLTPSPSATSTSTAGPPSCVFSGSFPYTLSCNFPVATTQATPAAGTCIGVSTPPAAGTIAYSCATPTAFPAVTSTPCSAPAAFSASTLFVPQGCLSGGGTCAATTCGIVLNPTPLPSPVQSSSPQPGWASTQYGYFAGLGPSPSPVINVPLYYYPTIGCGGTWGGIGTTTTQVNGITAGLMGLFCNGAWKFAVDGAGNIGVSNSLNTGGTIVLGGTGTSHEIIFPSDSGTNCLLIPESSFAHTIKITNDTSGGCNWDMSQSIGANALLGTNSNGVTAAVGVLPSKGQVSCTLSSLTCTATATVTASSRCTASYDDVSTTVTLALLLPLSEDVTSTTLTIKMQGAAGATGTAAADYVCF